MSPPRPLTSLPLKFIQELNWKKSVERGNNFISIRFNVCDVAASSSSLMSDDKVGSPQITLGLFNWAEALKCCQRQIREWLKLKRWTMCVQCIYLCICMQAENVQAEIERNHKFICLRKTQFYAFDWISIKKTFNSFLKLVKLCNKKFFKTLQMLKFSRTTASNCI